MDEIQGCLEFCKKSGLHYFFMEVPQNYTTLLGEQGINISGGQKQLIGLARALWRDPGFLIMDEPTSGMDKRMEKWVFGFINKIKGDKCIILVTHKINVARFSDQICVLENGIIDSMGNHNELMLTKNLYSTTFNELVEEINP